MTEKQDLSDLLIAAQEENSRLRAALAEAKGALEPFAEYLASASFDKDNHGNPLPDSQGMGWVYLTIGQFRTAAAVYAKLEEVG